MNFQRQIQLLQWPRKGVGEVGNGWKKVKRDINCVCAGGTIRSFPSLHLFIAAYSFCKHIKNVLGNRNLKPYYTEGAKKRIYIHI